MEFAIRIHCRGTIKRNKTANEEGLTLIELSIVILIMALMVSFAVPKIFILTEVNLRTSARKLAETIRIVQSFSITHASQYLIRYDIDKGTYTYAQGTEIAPGQWHYVLQDEDQEDKGESSAVGKSFQLAEGVFFQDIYDLVKEVKHDKGEIRTEFSPRGITTPILIHLGDNKTRFYTLLVDRYGGRVTLRKGNLSSSDFLSEESK